MYIYVLPLTDIVVGLSFGTVMDKSDTKLDGLLFGNLFLNISKK